MAGRGSRYGYQGYRGRGTGRSVLIFIILLLAVLFIAGVVFMAVMGDYISYTEHGMEINWPWRDQEASAPPEITDPVVIDTGDSIVTIEPSSDPTPAPIHYEPLAAVTVTADQLRYGTAAQMVTDAGGNTLVVEMKANNGKLAWQSQTELAGTLNVNAANNGVADAIQELAQDGDLYLVARVHCFKDPVLASAWIGTLMSQRGRIWYDYYGVSWSSPANQEAADYVSALCLELADMGFDEILLDDVGYPCWGEVYALATDENCPEDRTIPVSSFLQRIARELREKNVILSVYAYEELLPDEEVFSGMTTIVLAQSAGRVWLDNYVDRAYYEEILTAVGIDNLAARLVAPVDDAAEGGSWYR